MTNTSLAASYLTKARARLAILPVLDTAGAYSDVVREAQEIVELALKGILRHVGVEPPKWHDVGGFVREHRSRLATVDDGTVERLAEVSAWLRKEREFSFHGDIDFLPTEQYDPSDAARAIVDATFVVEIASRVIQPGGST